MGYVVFYSIILKFITMHYSLFRMSVIGNIGSVETINAGTDKELSKLTVACNGEYQKGEETIKTTDWVEVILSKKADVTKYSKGRKVLVEGVPKVNAYTGETGEAVGKQQIVAARVQLLDAKPGSTEETADE